MFPWPSCHHDTHAPRPHARPRWPGAAGFGRPGGLPVVHWGGRKRQNATWKAWQKKKPLVLNVHLLCLRIVLQGMQFPGCGRSQGVKLASRGILTSPKSPRANPMFLPRAVAPTLHGRFLFGLAYSQGRFLNEKLLYSCTGGGSEIREY